MSRTVAVTGVTGFIGTHLARRLRENGWTVIGVVRPGSTRPTAAGIVTRSARLVAGELLPVFEGAETVVHLAGVTRANSEGAYRTVNVEAAGEVALSASRVGARLVHVSSQAAAGCGTLSHPRKEHDAPSPLTAYGRSKLEGENRVRAVPDLGWTILRPVAVYGPGDRGFLPLFRLARIGCFPRITSGGAAFSLIHVDDVTGAIEVAMSNPAALHETFFIGHEKPTTGEEFATALAEAMGRRYRPLTLPRWSLRALASVGELSGRCGWPLAFDRSRLAELTGDGFVCSVEKAARAINFRAGIDLAPGLTSTAAWYAEHGWV